MAIVKIFHLKRKKWTVNIEIQSKNVPVNILDNAETSSWQGRRNLIYAPTLCPSGRNLEFVN